VPSFEEATKESGEKRKNMRGAIERSDLRVIAGDDQPRVLDIRLAERLGYERPRKIRDLIERNISELENYAPLPRLGAMVDRPQGGGRTSSVDCSTATLLPFPFPAPGNCRDGTTTPSRQTT
jgi:hypothetical protein